MKKSIDKYIRFVLAKIIYRSNIYDSLLNKSVKVQPHCDIRHSTIEKYTYISRNSSIYYSKIGAFCSIAQNVTIGGGTHNINAVSTSPIFETGKNIFDKNLGDSYIERYKITKIGNDVWIGLNSIILQGITIGDGAIIGAGSVVTRDVPPYAIVGENPARILRYRFDKEIIQKIEATNWWDWTDYKLKMVDMTSPEDMFQKLKGIKK